MTRGKMGENAKLKKPRPWGRVWGLGGEYQEAGQRATAGQLGQEAEVTARASGERGEGKGACGERRPGRPRVGSLSVS